jgi:hypothetical protein
MIAIQARSDPQHAARLLLKYLGARGGAEALLRAFLAERERDRQGARFWIDVYELILKEDQ